MFFINRFDFYYLLNQHINDTLTDMYDMMLSDKNPKNLDKYKSRIINNISLRKSYTTSKNTNKINELIILIESTERVLLDMFETKRECNRDNIKFVQMFLTMFMQYVKLVTSYESYTWALYAKFEGTIETIFNRITLE